MPEQGRIVSKLKQGQIIEAEVKDPQGRNPKHRPLVIVTPTDEINLDEPLLCVVVTGTLPKKLPADCILLPYANRGHPRTGLKKRCAAYCSWMVKIGIDQITRHIGRVPNNELKLILDGVTSLE